MANIDGITRPLIIGNLCKRCMHTCDVDSDTVTASKPSKDRETPGHPTSQKTRIRGQY